MLVSGRVPAELTLEKHIRLFYLFIDPAFHLAIIPIPCNVGGAKEPEISNNVLYTCSDLVRFPSQKV